MDYGTWHDENDATALVFTRPKKVSRTYRYQFHLREGVWVLSRPRDWYTEHALDYAQREFNRDVLHRHLPPNQSSLCDFEEEDRYEESASMVACNSD